MKENVTKLSSQLPLLRGQITWQSITSEKESIHMCIWRSQDMLKKSYTIIQDFLNFALKINNADIKKPVWSIL